MGRTIRHPLTPAECRRLLAGKVATTIGHNTRLERDDPAGGWRVRFHGSAVVTVHDDGAMTLTSAGHRTATTKERITRFLPPGCSVFQKGGVWYYAGPGGRVGLTDGMRVGPTGSAWRPEWATRDVVDLAEAIRAGGGYDRLPVLADALKVAGCDDPGILAGCRADVPADRWVVGLIPGRA